MLQRLNQYIDLHKVKQIRIAEKTSLTKDDISRTLDAERKSLDINYLISILRYLKDSTENFTPEILWEIVFGEKFDISDPQTAMEWAKNDLQNAKKEIEYLKTQLHQKEEQLTDAIASTRRLIEAYATPRKGNTEGPVEEKRNATDPSG